MLLVTLIQFVETLIDQVDGILMRGGMFMLSLILLEKLGLLTYHSTEDFSRGTSLTGHVKVASIGSL